MIEKDRKIYLKLVNSFVGLEFRLECCLGNPQSGMVPDGTGPIRISAVYPDFGL